MDTEQKAAAPKPPLEDFEAADERVVEALIRQLPDALRVAFAPQMRAVTMQAIHRERRRCGLQVERGVQFHASHVAECEQAILDAIKREDRLAVARLGAAREMEANNASVLRSIRQVVELPPGACGTCGGRCVVPSAVALPDGTHEAVACPACQVQPVQTQETVA